ncbi:MAG: L-serine ammonia-lyase, iron-sulfur-dependent subunit beta [Clostridiales bacterium]|nr:L-serine ammonia-lyase, iron-sulfur-dependent subunit beta [Clostridiales bacterium]
MIVSMFEVAGPIMVGPSSSHTAGAARLSRLATLFLSQPFTHVSFGLHGSFARTYHGHGTDLALVAGVLGIRQEDEEMKRSFQVAQERGITYNFYPTDLGDAHENSVVMDFTLQDGSHTRIVGSSVGGGRVLVTSFDGIETDVTLDFPTLLVIYEDRPGMLSRICAELAYANINIGVLRCGRKRKGGVACSVIETDSAIPADIRDTLIQLRGVQNAIILNPSEA